MSSYCPVCNGLSEFRAPCPACSSLASDCGRESDYYGPYSPYRPIREEKMTNGYLDELTQQCVHTAYCQQCEKAFPVFIQEWH